MEKIDNSLRAFKQYLIDFDSISKQDLSESDTRSKVVDYILKDILGWKELDIRREGHLESGYFDYRITLPGFHLLIEAKKQFKFLSLPSKHKISSINTLLTQNEDIIKQIRNYCTDSGVANGIITNGKQFIIGKFLNNDGTDWKKNECLIFDGFKEIENRFIDFYNNLSRECIIEHGGFKFSVVKDADKSQRIISNLIDRDAEIVRNNLSTKLSPIFNHIFGEIFSDNNEDDDELIRECFVENLETKKNRDEIERLFEDASPNLSEVSPAANIDTLVAQISNEIDEQNISAKEPLAPKPIILVGTKGAGKTTFLNYLFKKKLKAETLSKHPFVYIDFRKYYDHNKSFDSQLIAKDALDDLFSKYEEMELYSQTVLKRIYFLEIKQNDRGIWEDYKKDDPAAYRKKLSDFLEEKTKDSLTHLEMLSKYLIRDRRLRLILIIDNADQFDIGIQSKVFLFANSLNIKAHCGVFVSLREGYYYKWRNSPPFNAFESNVYHVTAPKYGEVLQKRINYTLKEIKIREEQSEMTSKEDEITYHDVIAFLSTVKNSMFEESNSKLVNFLNYTTFPNIREGLRIFKLFLTSGYTNVPEYIKRELFSTTTNSKSIPLHEFVKAIGLNNKLYYNHEISIVQNLFFPTNNSNDHFLKLHILKYLLDKIIQGGIAEKHEQFAIIIEDFVSYGYETNIIEKEIFELIKFEMIDTDELISDIEWNTLPSYQFNVSITAKGHYYYTELKNQVVYLDLILQDTPIFDPVHFTKISAAFPKADKNGKRYIYDRVQTIKLFMDYLKSQEKNQSGALIQRFGSIVDEINNSGLEIKLEELTQSANFDKN